MRGHALRQESYDEWYRRWCSALMHEQIAASLRGRRPKKGRAEDLPLGAWPWDRIRVPVMLCSGTEDDVPQMNVCSSCRTRAERYGAPRGRAHFFENTGHSIHDERPKMLAANIAEFVRDVTSRRSP